MTNLVQCLSCLVIDGLQHAFCYKIGEREDLVEQPRGYFRSRIMPGRDHTERDVGIAKLGILIVDLVESRHGLLSFPSGFYSSLRCWFE